MTVLTSTVINNAEIKEKIYYIWDDMVKGFALKVIPNGQKKYIIKYRTAMGGRSGVQRWYIFGDIQNLSCKEAREEAAKLFRMIHEGKDPQAEKASLREADTLTEFWELYVKDYASLKENKENYLKHTEPLWRLYIKPALGNRKITDINNLDIEHLHRSLARVKYNANRTLSLLNLLFNLMEKWNLRPPHTNPCRCVQRYKEDLRIRYLSSEEMARFTKELRDAETRKPEMVYTVAAIRLLLLTAARKNEILTCKWEWVDFDNHLINLPTSKTGKKTIFLNSKAVEILKELYLRPERELSEYIIKGRNFQGHNIDFKTAWYTIIRNAKIKNFRVHDLRHTAASMAISHGHSEAAIAKMLGHKSTAMIKHYAHLANKPVFDVANTISELINF